MNSAKSLRLTEEKDIITFYDWSECGKYKTDKLQFLKKKIWGFKEALVPPLLPRIRYFTGQYITFILKNNNWQWWEHSPPTTGQCGRGSNPGVDAICGLSLLLVLSLNLRGFSPGTPVFPSPQKPTLSKSSSIWNARTCLNKFLRTPRCFVAKQISKQTNMISTIWRLSVHQPA